MEISSSKHQPKGVDMNPHLAETFSLFFEHDYQAFTANSASVEITPAMVQEVFTGHRRLDTHNFVFIKR
jgi:hypothetical protein